VIFLDLPARTCLRGIAQRQLRHRGGQHAAIGVYDRITWTFIRYITGYRMLCRCRHSIRYAEARIMPSSRAACRPWVAAGVKTPA